MILSFLWIWTKWKSAMILKMNNMIPEINKNLIFLQRKRVNPKENFDPFVLIEHLLSDHEDDDQEVEDDDVASIEDDDLEQNVNFDAPESGYGDDDSDTPNINIDQGFAWIVYFFLKNQDM